MRITKMKLSNFYKWLVKSDEAQGKLERQPDSSFYHRVKQLIANAKKLG